MADSAESRRESFSQKMIDILNYGALNLAMGIGYRTGLYEVLDTIGRPETVQRIAEQAGLNARYVREWLGIMATAGVVEISQGDDGTDRFYLPKPHADLITKRAGSSNLGVYAQEIPLLTTCAMEAVVEGFRTGQGIDYDHYPKFQQFMSELADAKHERILVDHFLPSVDDGWLVERLKSGIRVCDIGCAEGVALLLMAQAFPNSRFVGIDFSEEVILTARQEAERKRLENVEFAHLDAATLTRNGDYERAFDYVTAFDSIHDQTQPLQALRGIHHILDRGGFFSMIDIAASSNLTDNLDHPMGPFLYTVSLMHCMPVGLVDEGTGLGMMWGQEKAVSMLKEAGFENIEVLEMPYDAFNLHFLCRK